MSIATGHADSAATASDVYRCILRVADNPSSLLVTEDGVIIDDELATMSGICAGISGPLP